MKLIHPLAFTMHTKTLVQDVNYEFGASGSIYQTDSRLLFTMDNPTLLKECRLDITTNKLRAWIVKETDERQMRLKK